MLETNKQKDEERRIENEREMKDRELLRMIEKQRNKIMTKKIL